MPNQFKGMRIPAEGVKFLDKVREETTVSSGQAVFMLTRFQNDCRQFAEFFRVGIERDGTRMVYVRDPRTNEAVDVLDSEEAERVLIYVLEELTKPFWESFRNVEPYVQHNWGVEALDEHDAMMAKQRELES